MTRLPMLVGLLFLLAVPVLGERPRPLGWAVEAAIRGNWDAAAQIAARDGAVAEDVIEWMRLRAGRGTYEDVIAFLERRQNWPGEPLLKKRSEAVVLRQSDSRILAFFDKEPPATAQGVLGHAAALSRAGQSGEAEANIVVAWRSMRMSDSEQALFLAEHESILKDHHSARLDRMLWEGSGADARRLYDLVSPAQVALAKARLGLKNQSKAVDALIAAVPKPLSDHPGLARDRFGWRVQKGRWDDAKDLIIKQSRSTEALGFPEYWSRQRRSLARDEMRDGDPVKAYQIASRHFLVEGSDYADLEWLSGYIALHYLKDAELALIHFQNHAAAVLSPISLGRAGYWIGRAWDDLNDPEKAKSAYQTGAKFQTSFYGILAAERAGVPFDVAFANSAPTQDWRTSDLAKNDVFQAGLLLHASGQLTMGERFWTHLAESLGEEDAGLLGQAAIDISEPHTAVMIGKRVAQRGLTLPGPYYALHPLAEVDLPIATDLALAIARRESEFDPSVQSGVGARGLMQIMPATGKEVAQSLGITDHTTSRLIDDPAYNARLGSTFLSQLAGRFDGNVILMSAAYNAGPSRPIRWMKLYGDPRQDRRNFDVVDWIEHIPFRETRNYVMRVTESLPIYRARLGQNPLPIPFSQELTGSTLKAFAP
ncbi:MAG: lytic transglycosylase domain-containing protein [Paracoccaceae bacterium]